VRACVCVCVCVGRVMRGSHAVYRPPPPNPILLCTSFSPLSAMVVIPRLLNYLVEMHRCRVFVYLVLFFSKQLLM
jgi:hypothetical protein